MIKEKGKRRGGADETLVKQRMRGEVEALMSGKVVIEVEKIFDSGVFDEDCQVILVEGAPGWAKQGLLTISAKNGQEAPWASLT